MMIGKLRAGFANFIRVAVEQDPLPNIFRCRLASAWLIAHRPGQPRMPQPTMPLLIQLGNGNAGDIGLSVLFEQRSEPPADIACPFRGQLKDKLVDQPVHLTAVVVA